MRPTSLVFAAALTFASHANAQPQSLTVPQAVANVQAVYANVSTYNAAFTQQYLIGAMHTTITSAGTVTFSRPSNMNWAYTQPPGNRVIVNGPRVSVYQAATNQTFVTNQAQVPAAFSFLTGQAQLASTFNFTMPSTLAFPGGYVLVGTPQTPMVGVTKVMFYVDAQTSQVRRVLVIDAQHNVNRFDFANVTTTNVTATNTPAANTAHP
jgi:outer membrane lipoprotein carrier protein